MANSEAVERAVRALKAVCGQVTAPEEAHEPGYEIYGTCSLAPCGSPDCAGCYEVEPSVWIHPPKCSEDYRMWLERWEAKGRVQ